MESTDVLPQATATQQWPNRTSRATLDDPLLHALIVLTKLHHRPFTAQALTAGLPLAADESLTPALFIRGAERAGLSAKYLKKKLDDLQDDLLPAVLLLKDRRVCILVSLNDMNAQVIFPETGTGTETISKMNLQNMYMGHCLLAKPRYDFGNRTDSVKPKEGSRWFWDVALKGWPVFSEVLLASLLINLFALATPFFILNVYDRVVPNNAIVTLWALSIGVFIVFTFDFFMRNMRTYFIEHTGKKIDKELSENIFSQLLAIKQERRPHSVGALANIVNAFDSFREFITSATISLIIDLPFSFFFILIIWFIGGPIAIIPTLAVFLIIAGSIALQYPIRKMILSAHQHSAEKQATLYEALSQIETVKTNNAESALQRRWEILIDEESKISIKLRILSGFTMSYTQYIQHLSTLGLIIYAVYLIGDNLLSLGGLVACIILSNRVVAPMSQISGLITRFYQSKASLHTLDGIMQLPTERDSHVNPVHREQFQGAIECRGMTFTYPNQAAPALKNISFKLKPKDKVGLVGRIGSGKTTLEKLLTGLYQATEGNILIDGIEMNQLDSADLRAHIGYIPQDIDLFYGTVKENIALGVPYVDDDQIITAATIAGVDQFIDTHPDGYNRQVGERGCLLSGGQRQAIAVARAILMDPPIIIMDEPTNCMDDKTETSLRNRLKTYLENKTLIVITHRASMLALVDRLIVIDKGQLVADGSKEYVLNALTEGRVKTS